MSKTAEKEWYKLHDFKKIKEVSCFQDGKFKCNLFESSNAAEYFETKEIDEIIFEKTNMVSISNTGISGAEFKDFGGCVLIEYRPKTLPERKILICSPEFKEKIDKSKLDKLVDEVTYP